MYQQFLKKTDFFDKLQENIKFKYMYIKISSRDYNNVIG